MSVLNKDFESRKITKEALQEYVQKLEQQLSELPLFMKYRLAQNLLKDSDVTEVISDHKSDTVIPIESEGNEYLTGWSIIKKAEFVLNSSNTGMTTAEIVDAILKIEPGLKDNRSKIVANLSGTLGAKAKVGTKITRRKNKLDEFVYYMVKWGSEIIPPDNEQEKTPTNNAEV